MQVYNFYTQFLRGNAGEERIHRWLTDSGLSVTPITCLTDQLNGKDFWVTPPGKPRFSVEVKQDLKSVETGNFYIEYELADKNGWALTCTADYVLLVTGDMVYMCHPQRLRLLIPTWKRMYKSAFCQGERGYYSRGLLIPIKEITALFFTLERPLWSEEIDTILTGLMRVTQ